MIVESKIVNPFRMGHGTSRISWSFLLARKNRRNIRRQMDRQFLTTNPANLTLAVLAFFVRGAWAGLLPVATR